VCNKWYGLRHAEGARDVGGRPDGRAVARSERTQAAVVDALLALTDEGDLRRQRRALRLRAGVSLRTVFQHFQDMDLLYAVAAERQERRMSSLLLPPPTEGSLDARIDALVAHRAGCWRRSLPCGAPRCCRSRSRT